MSEGTTVEVVLDESPFYAESGGQIGDQGLLKSTGSSIIVKDCQKAGGSNVYLHKGVIEHGSLATGDTVNTEVNLGLRNKIRWEACS